MKDAILSINPGTTTTRCAVYAVSEGTISLLAEATLEHDETQMATFASIPDQLQFRTRAVLEFLEGVTGCFRLVACAGRGGMLMPVPAGVIRVNRDLVTFALHTPRHQHASNLGAPLAYTIGQSLGAPAFVVDPVSVDQFSDLARVSGVPELPRFSFGHALNIRACGRRLAADLGKPFEQVRAVVAHLGAGFSIAALENGRIVDNTNRMEASPFTPERAGGLPPLALIDLCYSGRFTKDELKRKLYGNGGLMAALGTKDVRRVEAMIEAGDATAALYFDAMLYQVAKAIGAMASVLNYDLDAVVLTGGIAHSSRVREVLTQRVGRISEIVTYPGSDECRALAEGAARALAGQEHVIDWADLVRSAAE
ncbi:butyrate kinase [Thalassobius vesicularis]|uniref:Probable butyrate kinase n=1 Tax=Thalassobius vesicularis TaxID=1294297 RepID=A0A4S3M693_9RHOB|nr:butyrate kinase [Thalassobius vesicularis]THD72570.1 butyrate kinase [Thalassobius vesicularis]